MENNNKHIFLLNIHVYIYKIIKKNPGLMLRIPFGRQERTQRSQGHSFELWEIDLPFVLGLGCFFLSFLDVFCFFLFVFGVFFVCFLCFFLEGVVRFFGFGFLGFVLVACQKLVI